MSAASQGLFAQTAPEIGGENAASRRLPRGSGVLLHITSLPGPYGIGTMGRQARGFIDFLHAAGQRYWQVLPLCPTSFGDSPYQSPSAFAGNPYLIDLDTLAEEGLLRPEDYRNLDWGGGARVDYARQFSLRYGVLGRAYCNFTENADYFAFCEQSDWLNDYARFMARKAENGWKSWPEWRDETRANQAAPPGGPEESESGYLARPAFWKFVQYEFFRQWQSLKQYANGKGIRMVGDMPIYVAYDSADVWARPELFLLDETLAMTEVAGVPPDGFTEDGQLWGNPLYRWDRMAEDGYDWWVARIGEALKTFDVVRIDHFRGFAGYYAVPAGRTDARVGAWRTGPGYALFEAVEARLGRAAIIAEDLGYLDEDVRRLLRATGYPGMKILQFAFDAPDSEYLPKAYPANCVAYPGTHDNDTFLGWWRALAPAPKRRARRYLGMPPLASSPLKRMLKCLMASRADTVVVPMQDWLGEGSGARMNTPSTLGGNWTWRLEEIPSAALAAKMRRLAAESGRI